MIKNSKRNRLLALKSKKIKKGSQSTKEKTAKGEAQATKNDDLVQESRFNRVHFDPRFASLPKAALKEKIDSRFASMFTDDRFKVVSKTDKYGREVEAPERNKELERFYYKEEKEEVDVSPEEPEEEGKPQKKRAEGVPSKPKARPKPSSESKKKRNRQAQLDEGSAESSEEDEAGGGGFKWDAESSSSDSELRASDFEEDEDAAQGVWSDDSATLVRGEQSSHLLAMLNFDWAHLNATDIFILFNSLKPQSSIIKSVTIYPSDFGLEQMKIEEEQGPRTIWKEKVEEVMKQI